MTANRVAKKSVLLVAGLLLSVNGAQGAETAATSDAEPTREQRQQMAKLHEQMAVCLRSDKSFPECRNQMRAACQSTMGAQGCPMMGMGQGMHGRMRAPATDE